MPRTLLQQVLDCNRAYLSKNPEFLPPSEEPFLVLSCIDPRLTGLLEPALGLPPHRAMTVRTAGNTVSDSNRDALRSIAAGLYIKGAKEIFIVGHTDCALSKFQANEVIAGFRAAGIPRSVFGVEDLRSWFCAFHDPRENVLQSIEYLRKSGVVPAALKIHGMILNTATGSLEVVLDGDLPSSGGAVPPPAASQVALNGKNGSPESGSIPGTPSAPPISQAQIRKGPVVIETSPASGGQRKEHPPQGSLVDLAIQLRRIFNQEKGNPQFQRDLRNLGSLLKQERNPAQIVAALEKMAREYELKYPTLPAIIEQLRGMAGSKNASSALFVELIKRIFD